MITGKGVYSRLKFESGVHRVQRVPDTESSGRIHTSTATVAVLPVVEDVFKRLYVCTIWKPDRGNLYEYLSFSLCRGN